MSKLHQIQIGYEALEDRALLRIATTDSNEFRFWITRRYAKLLWSALSGSAANSGHAATQAQPLARDTVMAFEREAALAKADFKTGYQARPRETPLGQRPVLLARLKCSRLDDGATLLAMHPIEGQGIEVRLDGTLLHSLLKLLTDAATAGEWDLHMPSTELATDGPAN